MTHASILWLLSMVLIIITPTFIVFGTSYIDVLVIEILNLIILFGTQRVSRQ